MAPAFQRLIGNLDPLVARHLAVEARQREAALPYHAHLVAEWRDDGVDHHRPGQRLESDAGRNALGQDAIDDDTPAIIDLRRRNARGADPFQRVLHIRREARNVGIRRVVDRGSLPAQHGMPHLGDLTYGHCSSPPVPKNGPWRGRESAGTIPQRPGTTFRPCNSRSEGSWAGVGPEHARRRSTRAAELPILSARRKRPGSSPQTRLPARRSLESAV